MYLSVVLYTEALLTIITGSQDGYYPYQTELDILTGNIRISISLVLLSNQQDFIVHPRKKNHYHE